MNDKTIADWLREEAEYNHERLGSDMLNEAADTIEAQATRIEALEAALRWIGDKCDEEIPLEYNDAMRKTFQRNIRDFAHKALEGSAHG